MQDQTGNNVSPASNYSQDKRYRGNKTATLLSSSWWENTYEKSHPVQKFVMMIFFLKWNWTFKLQNMRNEKPNCQIIHLLKSHSLNPWAWSTTFICKNHIAAINRILKIKPPWAKHPSGLSFPTMLIQVYNDCFYKNSRHRTLATPQAPTRAEGGFLMPPSIQSLGPGSEVPAVAGLLSPSMLCFQLRRIHVICSLLMIWVSKQNVRDSSNVQVGPDATTRNERRLPRETKLVEWMAVHTSSATGR